MKSRHSILCLFLLSLIGCSAKQKRICQQNVAYQHGYQAAQQGESVDNASSYQGQICQDFEAYSPSMYRSDFKAGYYKGKKEYCSDYNFKKWGKEDGENSKIDGPNNYTRNMKICLQDDEYKKMAEKTYQNSFNEAFCNTERLQNLGIQQAKDFKPINVPNIKKRCGNKLAKQMESAMRISYKEQMKTNCTPSFWLIKGESDAVAKLSKSSELTKVQKCPSTVREKLITGYSKSYNERKALLIQEEKLALEKKRQEEMLELERKRQQQEYEIAKERNEIERVRLSGRPPYYSGNGRTFLYKGTKLSVRCLLDQQRHQAQIFVRNHSNRHVSISGNWKIRYYDESNKVIKTNKEYEHLSLSEQEEEDFHDRFAPWSARHCSAKFYP